MKESLGAAELDQREAERALAEARRAAQDEPGGGSRPEWEEISGVLEEAILKAEERAARQRLPSTPEFHLHQHMGGHETPSSIPGALTVKGFGMQISGKGKLAILFLVGALIIFVAAWLLGRRAPPIQVSPEPEHHAAHD